MVEESAMSSYTVTQNDIFGSTRFCTQIIGRGFANGWSIFDRSQNVSYRKSKRFCASLFRKNKVVFKDNQKSLGLCFCRYCKTKYYKSTRRINIFSNRLFFNGIFTIRRRTVYLIIFMNLVLKNYISVKCQKKH